MTVQVKVLSLHIVHKVIVCSARNMSSVSMQCNLRHDTEIAQKKSFEREHRVTEIGCCNVF